MFGNPIGDELPHVETTYVFQDESGRHSVTFILADKKAAAEGPGYLHRYTVAYEQMNANGARLLSLSARQCKNKKV